MFVDEARFGRMNRMRPCWAPIGTRPEVAAQLIREYIYLYGAVSPKDGTCVYLIMPTSNTACFQSFLNVPVAKIRQAGHPVGPRWSSKPSLRRSLGAKQHYAAVPAALRARTQSKGESLG